MRIEVEFNGRPEVWDIAPGERLLDVMRRRGVMSLKRGCETGDCGSCTVLLDDQPVNACVVTAARAQGRRIRSLEGLGDDELMQRLQKAFVAGGAIQCGYCTPGMLITLYATLREKPAAQLDEAAIRQALSGNLCRCTGYVKPVAAAAAVLAAMREEPR